MAPLLTVVLAAAPLPACGSANDDAAPPEEPVACTESPGPVPAGEVVVEGELTYAERTTVAWALRRFDEAGLELPARLQVGFDPSGVACHGARALCPDPGAEAPIVLVCEAEGDNTYRVLNRQISLLHELAHVWHRASSDDPRLADIESVVGGVDGGGDDVDWRDRAEERVAVVISWGLLDQPRRPVQSDQSCAALRSQFRALTGTEPLGPLEPDCLD